MRQKVCFNYNLFLKQSSNPLVSQLHHKKLRFTNKKHEFHHKLTKTGEVSAVQSIWFSNSSHSCAISFSTVALFLLLGHGCSWRQWNDAQNWCRLYHAVFSRILWPQEDQIAPCYEGEHMLLWIFFSIQEFWSSLTFWYQGA